MMLRLKTTNKYTNKQQQQQLYKTHMFKGTIHAIQLVRELRYIVHPFAPTEEGTKWNLTLRPPYIVSAMASGTRKQQTTKERRGAACSGNLPVILCAWTELEKLSPSVVQPTSSPGRKESYQKARTYGIQKYIKKDH